MPGPGSYSTDKLPIHNYSYSMGNKFQLSAKNLMKTPGPGAYNSEVSLKLINGNS